MRQTLLVTNDFPPRKGGIQTYLEGFVRQLDPTKLTVLTSTPQGEDWQEWDSKQPWQTIRMGTHLLLPTPGVRAKMQEIIREKEIDVVWFGAAAPLGLLAQSARKAGAQKIIATTHGHEIGWSMIPGAKQLLRTIFAHCDTITYLTEATLRRLRSCLPPNAHLIRMPGGINPQDFAYSPTWDKQLRERYSLGNAPVVACISRLVERKGQDMLIRVWPRVIEKFPDAHLVIVGKGPYQQKLERMRSSSPAADSILLTGEVPFEELPAHYSLADIFAMPCRTRGGGLDIEGLGIVYLEAYAAGKAVIAGDSGGAPEAVIDGQTGYVVNGRSEDALVAALCELLEEKEKAQSMGRSGRQWVENSWRWEILVKPLVRELA